MFYNVFWLSTALAEALRVRSERSTEEEFLLQVRLIPCHHL